MLEITEIKARLVDPESSVSAIHKCCGEPIEIIFQEDLFFDCPKGKLKLRILKNNVGELISYSRDKEGGVKHCKFNIYNTKDAGSLKEVLSASYVTAGSVTKKRTLYMYDNVRIHIDQVESLGAFIEIEVPINNLAPTESENLIQALMKKFKISASDIIEGAYIDLLKNKESR